MAFQAIACEAIDGTGIIRLNRPEVLNAINTQMIAEVGRAVADFDEDPKIGCLVITGNERAFAAGADIKEMQHRTFPDTYLSGFLREWDTIDRRRKPMIAAVAGFALGGGCELATMCDFIIAADNARFGQPEITIGLIPGAGATQRLARYIGKAKAMDLILTGRMMDAAEAERCGLVSRVVAPEQLMNEALAVSQRVASYSRMAVLMAREAVERSAEMPLQEGLRFERRLFEALFATADQKEGAAAFLEKRPPRFMNG